MEWTVIGVAIAIVAIAIVIFNSLVRMRNVVREGWSGIDVQLRRRTDLVPNLVETVKGYAAHERGLFEDVAKNRAQSTQPTMLADRRPRRRRCKARSVGYWQSPRLIRN